MRSNKMDDIFCNKESALTGKWRSFLFSFSVAKRYLFSKKSHNAINIISAISSIGVCIGAIALVCVLSVFNGFESLIGGFFSTFDPDLKITLVHGKVFEVDDPAFDNIRSMPSVINFTEVVEGNVLLRFKEKQSPAILKGVTDQFKEMTKIDSIIYDGKFILFDGAFERVVPGIGVASVLGLNPYFIDPLYIYAPKRTSRINLLRPESSFKSESAFVSGIFSVQQLQYDDNLILSSVGLAREVFEYDSTTVSAVELRIKSDSDKAKVQQDIKNLLGDRFNVKNRYEQQESFFNIMKIEKFITYLILCFILLIASFNIIGSLSMLILDKKDDIMILRNLGAEESQIKRIFLFEGWMISGVGALLGVILGTVICFIQQHFGLLKLGDGFVVSAYPVVLNWSDIVLVFFTVLLMGFIAAWYPVRYIKVKDDTTK